MYLVGVGHGFGEIAFVAGLLGGTLFLFLGSSRGGGILVCTACVRVDPVVVYSTWEKFSVENKGYKKIARVLIWIPIRTHVSRENKSSQNVLGKTYLFCISRVVAPMVRTGCCMSNCGDINCAQKKK